MALEILVYDLDAESRKLPTGCVYTRAGAAWVVEAGRLRVLAANEPMWGPRGLIVEDAATNLLALSQPSSGAEWSNGALYEFPGAVSMLAGGTALSHAAKGTSDAPVREIDDPLPDDAVALGTVWALVECLDNVYVDIGTRDGAQNWVDRARWAQPHGLAYPLPSDRIDMQALGRLRGEIGPNRGRLIELACVSPTGLDARKLGVAPTGDHQNHLRAVLHHIQVEAGPGPTSPIVTTSGAGTRNRATAIATVLSVGAQQTSLQILGQAPVWMGNRQVVWQMDANTDADGQRVALERTAAGQLQLVCGGALLDLGKLANGESFGVGLQVSGGTMRASRDGLSVVSVAATLPAATKERWGHGYAAGAAFSGETIRQRRWLSVATDDELRALSVDSLALPGDQSTLTPPALYAADFARARAPTALLENAVVPSSGNARLLQVYAGSGRVVYRKARSANSKQELSWKGTRRVENLLAAADIHQSSGMGIGGSNVTAIGTATHLGLVCDFITWPALTHSWPTSHVQISPALNLIFPGVVITGRIDVAVSRDLTAGESIRFAISGSALTADRICSGLKAGRFYSIAINDGLAAAAATGNTAMYAAIVDGSVVASPLTINFRARQIVDSTGLAASELVQPFVDPGRNYGAGCDGAAHFHTVCANTVDATTGEIIEAEGALISPTPGMAWQPAAAMVNTYSPPDTGVPNNSLVTYTAAPIAVAGLPAVRSTCDAANGIHGSYVSYPAPFSGRALIKILFRKHALVRPHLYLITDTWNNFCCTNVNYDGVEFRDAPAHAEYGSLVHKGDDCYEMTFSAVFASEPNPAAFYRIAKNDQTEVFVGAGEYLDIAAFNVCNTPFIGTPMLASNGQTARGADNPLIAHPAIGTSEFTARIELDIQKMPPSGVYPMIFVPQADQGNDPRCYMDATSIYANDDGGRSVSRPVYVGRHRVVVRRKSNGVTTLWVDNQAAVSTSAGGMTDCTGSPIFGAPQGSYNFGVKFQVNELRYFAMSDAECSTWAGQ